MLLKILTLHRSLSVLLIFLALIAAYQVGVMTAPRSGGQTASINQPAVEYACTYLIFTDGTNTYGQNCETGAIDYGGPSNLGGATGTLPEIVINLAIAHGGKIFIKAGSYTFTTTPINIAVSGGAAAIGTTTVSDVELFGEGNSTILRGGLNLSGSAEVIGVLNANSWYIHDLQIDGNSEHQNGTKFSTGILLWNSNNSTIQQCYVRDNKNVGIDIEQSASDEILNNRIKNSGANGIQVDGGAKYLIQGNTSDGSSDIGISISGTNAYSGSLVITNVVCIGNTVENLSLGVSPYGENGATGIKIGDNGLASHIVVSENQVYGPGLVGIATIPGLGTNLDILISRNEVNGTTNQGIIGLATTGLLVEGNALDQPGDEGILIGSTVTDASVTGNYINGTATRAGLKIEAAKTLVEGNDIEDGETGIDVSGAQTNIVGNTASDSTYAGLILDSGSDDSLTVGNHVYMTAGQTGIYVNSKDNTVSSNQIYAANGGIDITSTAVGTVVTGNDVRNSSSPYRIQDSGVRTVITGNAGYNPVGNIGSPFVSSSKMILDTGGSSTPVNATKMTVWESPKVISVLISSPFSSGYTFVLQIDGTQIVSTNAPAAQITPYVFTLQPGETFYCQYQTGKVTFVVSGQ